MIAGGSHPSFGLAAKMLGQLAEVTISGRQVGRITEEIGQEMAEKRDLKTASRVGQRSRARNRARPGTLGTATPVPGQDPGLGGHWRSTGGCGRNGWGTVPRSRLRFWSWVA